MIKEQETEEASELLKQLQTETLFCPITTYITSEPNYTPSSKAKFLTQNHDLFPFPAITVKDKPPRHS